MLKCSLSDLLLKSLQEGARNREKPVDNPAIRDSQAGNESSM